MRTESNMESIEKPEYTGINENEAIKARRTWTYQSIVTQWEHLDQSIVSTMGRTLIDELKPRVTARDDRLRRIRISSEPMQQNEFYLITRVVGPMDKQAWRNGAGCSYVFHRQSQPPGYQCGIAKAADIP